MKHVVVMVKREGEARVQDLELPADVPIQDWVHKMAQVLGWVDDEIEEDSSSPIRLTAYGPRTPEKGLPVSMDSTLEQAGVMDGFWLVGSIQSTAAGTPSAPGTRIPSRKKPRTKPAPVEARPKVAWEDILPEAAGKVSGEEPGGQEENDEPDWLDREIDDL
jgi:hypothetical protein